MSTPLEKITKLLALAAGASNPNEAAAALANAQAIADRYSISPEEIARSRARAHAQATTSAATVSDHGHGEVQRKTLYTHDSSTKPAWLFELGNVLAFVNDCHMVGRHTPGGYELIVFGTEMSIAVVERLFAHIMIQIERLAAQYPVPRGGAHLKRAYRLGCVATVSSALLANYGQRTKNYGDNASTALVVFKSRADAAQAASAAWAESLGAKVREVGRASMGDEYAFRDGVRDGRSVRSTLQAEMSASSGGVRALPPGPPR